MAPPDGTHRRLCEAKFRQRGAGIRRIRTGWSRLPQAEARLLKGAGCTPACRLRERIPDAEPENLRKSAGTLSLLPSSRQVALTPSSSEEGKVTTDRAAAHHWRKARVTPDRAAAHHQRKARETIDRAAVYHRRKAGVTTDRAAAYHQRKAGATTDCAAAHHWRKAGVRAFFWLHLMGELAARLRAD